jgi:putative hydrolase of the HAD superfamily
VTPRDTDGPPFRVSHVIFDVDGTLVDFAGAFRAAVDAAVAVASQAAGTAVTVDQLRDAQRLAVAELRTRDIQRDQVRDGSLRRALAAVGCDEAGVTLAFEAFERARDERLVPYDDVEETLVTLQERGIVMLAASNGTVKMAQLPVFKYFTALWFAREAGVAKPDPRFFLGALEHVGATPQVALMVGDRLDNDYEPARGIGMQAVLIDREARARNLEVSRIESLAELPGLIEPLPGN